MSGSDDEKQIIININLADHFPQPAAPQFYPAPQPPVMPRQAIAFPNPLKSLDFEVDGWWALTFVFVLIALYPSADARLFMAWRGDAAGGIIDSAPIPDNPFENEFIDPAPAPKPQTAPDSKPKAPSAKPAPGTIFKPNPSPKNFSPISQARRKIAELAIADARKGLRYKVGQSARCADYVENVLSRAGWNAKETITKQPVDKFRDTGKYMANRWFGPDMGEIITDPSKLQIGDLVAFRNTYGNWRKGAITHVGIYVGRGMIVDRGTSAAPVLYRSLRTFDKGGESKFSVGVRLHEKWLGG